MEQRTAVRVGDRELAVSNLDKVLYPATGTTKADVLRYYLGVADVMLPHLAGRPVTMRRFPDGVEAASFYQKRCPDHRPDWMTTVEVARGRGGDPAVAHCELAEPAALVWAANLGGLELHVPMGRHPDVDDPTMIVFDLDPGAPAGLLDCAWLALRIRDALDHLGLHGWPKTSGGKGLQVYVPLNTPGVGYERARGFAQALGATLERVHPDRVVTVQTKTKRTGRVLIDWSQNHRTKTTVCAYSLRGRERPTASTPVTWGEVEAVATTGDAGTLVFDHEDVLVRVEQHGDMFAPVLDVVQDLPTLRAPD